MQIRLMGNFGINGGVPWLTNTDGELCLLRKESVEDVSHFLLDCPNFRDNHESLWSNLMQISHFFQQFRQRTKDSIAIGGSSSPF